MQKNIENKKHLKEKIQQKKVQKEKEDDDMQLNTVAKVPINKNQESESESDSEDENIEKIKNENLNALNELGNQDIFDSNATFKTIGVINKNIQNFKIIKKYF